MVIRPLVGILISTVTSAICFLVHGFTITKAETLSILARKATWKIIKIEQLLLMITHTKQVMHVTINNYSMSLRWI